MALKTLHTNLVVITLIVEIFSVNSTLISRLNAVLSGQGLSAFGPTPWHNLTLPVNNLKETTLENDKYYINFAFASYCVETLTSWTCINCKILGPNVHFVTQITENVVGAKAFFAIDYVRKEIVLAFRGSINLRNFVFDAILIPVAVKSDIRVHPGCYMSTLSMYNRVVEVLTALTSKHPSFKVVVTGHSLGGCEASLTIFLLKGNNVFPRTSFELYSYGGPRIGNQNFAIFMNSLDIPAARIIHGPDFVAYLFTPYSLGYVHHQNEVWELESGMVWKNCSRRVFEDLRCSASQAPILTRPLDHGKYFGQDAGDCVLEDPLALLLQVVLNLKPLVPPALEKELQELIARLGPTNRFLKLLAAFQPS